MSADWDRLAPYYDAQLWLERPALECAVELADVDSADRLVDLGTGTGGFLRVLAGSSRPDEVVGVDVSPGMLARVPRLPAGWELRWADAGDLPFADAHFHVATATYVLHLLDARSCAEALSELHRVLLTGGRLVTVTPSAPRSGLGFPWAVTAAALRRLAPRICAGLRPYDPRADLAAAGFVVEQARYVSWGYPSLCVQAVKR